MIAFSARRIAFSPIAGGLRMCEAVAEPGGFHKLSPICGSWVYGRFRKPAAQELYTIFKALDLQCAPLAKLATDQLNRMLSAQPTIRAHAAADRLVIRNRQLSRLHAPQMRQNRA